jgi:branched-chain amino acid transport system ATP-binding protein
MLTVRSLQLGYGAIVAVRGIDLDVGTGELVAVIGANGAGKTTSLNGIAGALPVRAGSIVFDGEDITLLPVHERVRRGMSLVPEGREVFPFLSVLDNLKMGAYVRRDTDGIATDIEQVFEYFPSLRKAARRAAMSLSGGEQQMLAIGRALMSNPRMMLLDEPSLGLSPRLVGEIFTILARINAERGVTLLVVEQNASVALKTARIGHARLTENRERAHHSDNRSQQPDHGSDNSDNRNIADFCFDRLGLA